VPQPQAAEPLAFAATLSAASLGRPPASARRRWPPKVRTGDHSGNTGGGGGARPENSAAA
jgi:hypothetical protein